MIKYIKSDFDGEVDYDEFDDDTLYTITITNGKDERTFDYGTVNPDIDALADVLNDYLYDINF